MRQRYNFLFFIHHKFLSVAHDGIMNNKSHRTLKQLQQQFLHLPLRQEHYRTYIRRQWSVFPRGAFFCPVAAALIILLTRPRHAQGGPPPLCVRTAPSKLEKRPILRLATATEAQTCAGGFSPQKHFGSPKRVP